MIEGYEGLNNNITQTIELISGIEAASKEQQVGIEQINDAVNSLDQQTQQNANIASQTHEVAMQTDTIAKLIVEDVNKKEFIGKDRVQAKKMNSSVSTPSQNPTSTPSVKPTTQPSLSTPSSTNGITPITSSQADDDEWASF